MLERMPGNAIIEISKLSPDLRPDLTALTFAFFELREHPFATRYQHSERLFAGAWQRTLGFQLPAQFVYECLNPSLELSPRLSRQATVNEQSDVGALTKLPFEEVS